jgi:hypothetical protein
MTEKEKLLFFGLEESDFDQVFNMLSLGADVNVRYDGVIAARKGNTPLIHLACFGFKNNTSQIIGLLTGRGADVDAVNCDGFTALMIAARTGNDFVVEQLISLGAKLDTENKHKRNALDLAFDAHHHTTIKILMDAAKRQNVLLRTRAMCSADAIERRRLARELAKYMTK